MRKRTILFLAANPVKTNPLAIPEEARAIRSGLQLSRYRDCFELATRWAVEPLDLFPYLRQMRPAVVHFSGHGSPTPRARGVSARTQHRDVIVDDGPADVIVDDGRTDPEPHPGLFFHGPDGQVRVVTGEALREILRAAESSVKLVVLSACHSDALAEALRVHVDCVVGMRGTIEDAAAGNFAKEFYGALGDGASVDSAFRQGCAAAGQHRLTAGTQPQLKTRDGVDATKLILASPPADEPDGWQEIQPLADNTADAREFFARGERPSWATIWAGIDAPRRLVERIKHSCEQKKGRWPSVTLLTGSPGTGKTTALMRACATLIDEDWLVYQPKSPERLESPYAAPHHARWLFVVDDAHRIPGSATAMAWAVRRGHAYHCSWSFLIAMSSSERDTWMTEFREMAPEAQIRVLDTALSDEDIAPLLTRAHELSTEIGLVRERATEAAVRLYLQSHGIVAILQLTEWLCADDASRLTEPDDVLKVLIGRVAIAAELGLRVPHEVFEQWAGSAAAARSQLRGSLAGESILTVDVTGVGMRNAGEARQWFQSHERPDLVRLCLDCMARPGGSRFAATLADRAAHALARTTRSVLVDVAAGLSPRQWQAAGLAGLSSWWALSTTSDALWSDTSFAGPKATLLAALAGSEPLDETIVSDLAHGIASLMRRAVPESELMLWARPLRIRPTVAI